MEHFSAFNDERVVRAVHALCDAPAVAGGTAFSLETGLYMAYVRPDYGIRGEGEEAFPALLDALPGGTADPDTIPGLVTDTVPWNTGSRKSGTAAGHWVSTLSFSWTAHSIIPRTMRFRRGSR